MTMENLSLSEPQRDGISRMGENAGSGAAAAPPPGPPQLPPQMFTTAAQLLDLTDSEVLPPCMPILFCQVEDCHVTMPICPRGSGFSFSVSNGARESEWSLWDGDDKLKQNLSSAYGLVADRGEPHREIDACLARRKKADRGAEELGPIWYAGLPSALTSCSIAEILAIG